MGSAWFWCLLLIKEQIIMTRKNIQDKIPDWMRFSGGFDNSDREEAEWQLKETQRKLGGVWIPPLERGDDRETATIKLNETLSGKRRKVVVAPPEEVVMKMDEAPKATSKKQAANQLRRTQKLLSNAQLKQNAAPAKTTPSISAFPKRDARKEDLLAAIKRLLDRKDELTVADIAKALNIDPAYAMELCKELENAGLADLS
jgi:hypothetical protein